MGYGISMPKVRTTSACLRNNDGAVADGVILVLPAEHAVPMEKMGSEGKEGPKDELERDDIIECPRSPSFKVFCTHENTQGDDNAEEVEKGKQQCDAENDNNKEWN
ncbi:hypothetical protein F3Y22_tig00111467pilonHSYRG00032 [Hibiscus syriacus]|uniref:Uncharacterized protein n=1 Tax=Hibiscus syriacus TaxID=106335 RepID=A0A6A2Y821_HIBSY|nr:hypothetical protein F3Y22_tig00111467pilonHSYRG00032 [Hibiscus syriacus]